MFRTLLALALAATAPAPAAADAAWPAIGVVTQQPAAPGGAICTGTLVAPDLVLTAGHCLGLRAKAPPAPGRFTFTAGHPTESRQGTAVIRTARRGLPGDIALLVLAPPLASVTPLAVIPAPATAPAPGGRLMRVAYRREAPDTPEPATPCRVAAADVQVLGLDCPAVSGNSGAPLLVRAPEGWSVAGVMVARSERPGPVRSFAVTLPDDLVRAIAARSTP